MSGGRFNYAQFGILDIIYEIESTIRNSGNLIPKESLYNTDEYYIKYPDELYYAEYDDDDTLDIMRIAVDKLKIAYIYTQRIDWFLSGDDGRKTLKQRLDDDLNGMV